jgi:hypothetical protein
MFWVPGMVTLMDDLKMSTSVVWLDQDFGLRKRVARLDEHGIPTQADD